MLRNVFLKTLRDNRIAILVWGLGLGLLMIIGATQYPLFVSGDEGQRARQAAELAKLFQAYSFMLGEMVPLDTLGGFITVRLLSQVPIMLALWMMVAGVGVIRGEEEPGILDVLLSTPHSRRAVFAQKVVALAVALAVAVVLLVALMAAGALAISEPLPLAGLAATALNIFTIALFWGAVALLVGQLVSTRRGGWGVVGTLVIGAALLNNVFEGNQDLKNLAWLFPFHYYSLSKPLVPGRGLDGGPWLALAAATVIVLALAAWLFAHRDLGAAFRLWPDRRPAGVAPAGGGSLALLGSVFSKSIRDLLWPTLGWGLGLAFYAAVLVGTAESTLEPLRAALQNIPFAATLAGNLASNEAYLSTGLFLTLPLLLAFFGLTQVWGWANEEEEGRLELLTAQPVPRPHLLLARYGAATLSLVGILALFGVGIFGTAAGVGMALDAGLVLGGLGTALPLPLVVIGFGLALATWLQRPGPAVGITGAAIVAAYFLEMLAQVFGWPEPVRNLSIFHLYGRPLIDGVAWGNVAVLVTAALALAAASLVGFQRRDIAK